MSDRDIEQLGINVIRGLAMDAPQKANSGHPGTAMALAPLAHVLWTRIMRHDPSDPDWPDRDRFILSCGHASILLYSMLYLTGYGMTLDDIKNFRQLHSRTPGHPEVHHAPGTGLPVGRLGLPGARVQLQQQARRLGVVGGAQGVEVQPPGPGHEVAAAAGYHHHVVVGAERDGRSLHRLVADLVARS